MRRTEVDEQACDAGAEDARDAAGVLDEAGARLSALTEEVDVLEDRLKEMERDRDALLNRVNELLDEIDALDERVDELEGEA